MSIFPQRIVVAVHRYAQTSCQYNTTWVRKTYPAMRACLTTWVRKTYPAMRACLRLKFAKHIDVTCVLQENCALYTVSCGGNLCLVEN